MLGYVARGVAELVTFPLDIHIMKTQTGKHFAMKPECLAITVVSKSAIAGIHMDISEFITERVYIPPLLKHVVLSGMLSIVRNPFCNLTKTLATSCKYRPFAGIPIAIAEEMSTTAITMTVYDSFPCESYLFKGLLCALISSPIVYPLKTSKNRVVVNSTKTTSLYDGFSSYLACNVVYQIVWLSLLTNVTSSCAS